MAVCQSLSYTPQNFRRRTSHLIHYTSDFASHTRTHTSRPPSHTLKISDPPHEVQHLRPYSSDVGPIFVIALQTSHLRGPNSDLATFLTLLFCVVVYLKNRCVAKRCDALRCDAIRCESCAMRCDAAPAAPAAHAAPAALKTTKRTFFTGTDCNTVRDGI